MADKEGKLESRGGIGTGRDRCGEGVLAADALLVYLCDPVAARAGTDANNRSVARETAYVKTHKQRKKRLE